MTTPWQRSVDWPLTTARLRIRPAVPQDAEATWSYRRLPSANEWIGMAPSQLEEHRALASEPSRLARTLIVTAGGRVVGDLMLAVEDAWAQHEVVDRAHGVQAELGWCFDPQVAGRGYATEAVAALISVCFDQLGLRRVVANCFVDNERSWRLMERLGMRREVHTIRDSLHRSHGWLDGLGYALLADEWPRRMSR